MIHTNTFIHPTSIIEDGAIIENNVKIGAFCIVGSKVVIQENTVVKNHTCIYGRTTIGKNNTIFSHTVIGSTPQDLKYEGEDTQVIIGDNNKIREFCLINIGTKNGGGKTIIGNNNLIMSHSHIAHDCIISNDCVLASNSILAGHIVIEDLVIIGGASAVHQFVHIGECSMLAGGSILTQDLPPFCLAQGNRATIKSINVVGIRRKLPKEIDNLRKVFKLFFRKKENMKKNIEEFYENTDNKYIKSICLFVKNSKRGIPLDKDTQEKENNDTV